MLRITTTTTGEQVTLKLEGKLSGPWVEEFQRCWATAKDVYQQKRLVVDLSSVTFVDPSGKKLLCSISGEGTRLVGSGLIPKSVIDEICDPAEKSEKTKLRHETSLLLLLVAFSLLFPWQTRAADAAPLRLTLREAVATALKEYPQVQIAMLNYAQSQQDKNLARSALLPQAGVEVFDRAQRYNIYSEFGQRLPEFPEHTGPFQFFQAGLVGTMPVLDLTLWRRWQQAHQAMNASRAEQNTVQEQVVLLVVSQYLSGMRATAALTAARSRVDLAQALFTQASDLQKNGVGTGIDTLRANVQLQNEKQRLLEAETQQKVALYGLARLLNLNPQIEIELADNPSFYETPEIEVNQSLEAAYQTRPEMRELEAQTHVAELALRAASESRLPTMNLFANWGQQGLSASTVIPAYTFQVTVDVPLFTSGRIRAEVARSNLELKKFAQRRSDLRDQIALEVKSSKAQLDSARHEVDVANLGVNLANQEVTQARDRFQAGVANNIEVISAQDALARANDNQIAALYQYNQSRADFAHAVGQIETLYSK